MASNSHLKVLIVDDFNSFRLTLSKIMYELGFKNVENVASGEDAIALCLKNHFDLILADYNLGLGKNGQQFLEELRTRKVLQANDVFILLSAETSRNVVMSAYDCEPDAYLTKPITMKVIEQRLKRLMNKRNEMKEINEALALGELGYSIDCLEQKIAQQSRYSTDCQKLLAELYIDTKQYDKAERLYRSVLEVRVLDWAQIGLSHVKIKTGNAALAAKWLNKIIIENPSSMKAYDMLSYALRELDKTEELQVNLEKAVTVSPMSLGRQASLARVAQDNGDTEIAAICYRKIIKQGANSEHNSIENQLNYVSSVARLFDKNASKADSLVKEAQKIATQIDSDSSKNKKQKLKSKLLSSQLHGLSGETDKSNVILEETLAEIDKQDLPDVDVDIEIFNALSASGKTSEAQKKLTDMLDLYAGNEPALEKIDYLVPEPVSVKGRHILSKENKKGIQAYKSKQYKTAMSCFTRLEKRYPRYIGVKLNLVQTLVGNIRELGRDEESELRCESVLETLQRSIKQDDPQFKRFLQLAEMLTVIKQNKG